jgi:malate permease and related proteins
MVEFLLLTAGLLGLALLLRKLPTAPAIADNLNWWVLYVALPAAVLELIPRLHFDVHLWYLAGAQWLGCIVAALVFPALGRRLGWSRPRIAAATLMACFSNTAFIGLPMMEALRGPEGMSMAAIADQLGCFAAFNTVGTAIVALYVGDNPSPGVIIKRMLLFPAFDATVIALVVGALGGWPPVVPAVLHKLTVTLSPLAVFSVGLRLRLKPLPGDLAATTVVGAWKIGLMPLLALAFGRLVGVQGLPLGVAVMQAGMAPMFTSAILARRHGFDPEFTDTVVSITMVLSFVTVPLWSLVVP